MRRRLGVALGITILGLAGALWNFQPQFEVARGAAPAAVAPAAVAASPAAGTQAAAPFVNAHMLIIVRHADIDISLKPTMGNKTPLLPRGEERAKELLVALEDVGITRVLSSDSIRTQQTAMPLADELHLKQERAVAAAPARAPAAGGNATIADEAAALYQFLADTSKPGDTILLVHHHTVIPPLMAYFGVKEPPIDDATEFDRMYVVVPDAVHHTYQVMRLRYGGSWPGK